MAVVNDEFGFAGEEGALPDLAGFGGLPDDPVKRLRQMIEDRQEETLEILKGWMENDEEERA